MDDYDILEGYAYQAPVIVVRKDAPWNTIEEFVADCKAHPGKRTIGVSDIGGTYHQPMVLWMDEAGFDAKAIAHRCDRLFFCKNFWGAGVFRKGGSMRRWYLFILLPLVSVLAREESAIVLTLKNGDRMAGRFWRMTGDYVLVEPPYGVFRIRRKYVAKYEIKNSASGRSVLVRFRNGESATAMFLSSDSLGLKVRMEGSERAFSWEEVGEMSLIDP